jgi:hypothetical protein
MKKQIRALVQIGVIYLVVSIVLDFFLAGYPILTWTALGFVFILFAVMIFDVLWELTPRPTATRVRRIASSEDELTGLEKLCHNAIDQGDPAAGQLLSERIRSLAFSAAAHHVNTSEALLRTMAEQDRDALHSRIGDQLMVEVLIASGSIVTKGNPQNLEDYLAKVEDWTN